MTLVFLHVPKTGGTSLTSDIGRHFAANRRFTDNGNITRDLLRQHSAELEGPCFIHGHPDHGVMDLLGDARLATVLRRPAEQAVSNYLFIRRNPHLPMHPDAMNMDFARFLSVNWQCLVFQSVCLDVGQSAVTIDSREEFFRRLPAIQALLDRIDFVGCLDRLDDFLGVLATAHGWPAPSPASRLNTAQEAGVDASQVAELLRIYEGLWRDPMAAPLMAAEECLYARARRIVLAPRRTEAPAGAGAKHPLTRLAPWMRVPRSPRQGARTA